MNTRSDNAVELFKQGYNCAQSVLHAFQPGLGVDSATAMKCACGFGAGMGRMQEVCGAVSGGVMVLGLKHGRAIGDDKAVCEDAYARTRELIRRFTVQCGSCRCRELLGGLDLQTEAGRAAFRERNYLNDRCAVYVREVVRLVEELEAAPAAD